MIRIREVIAILDADVTKNPANSLSNLQKWKDESENISEHQIKSYVVTPNRVYASPISSTTLKKRADQSQKMWK